jgi:hypothetical protein
MQSSLIETASLKPLRTCPDGGPEQRGDEYHTKHRWQSTNQKHEWHSAKQPKHGAKTDENAEGYSHPDQQVECGAEAESQH